MITRNRSSAITHWLVAAVCAAATASCSSPGGPTTTVDRIPLSVGAYEFFFSQLNPPPECGVTGVLPAATVRARVTLSHEGSNWAARSTAAADGDFELLFHDSGGPITGSVSTIQFLPIVVTMKGTAKDTKDPGVVRTFVLSGPAATSPLGSAVLLGQTFDPVSGLGSPIVAQGLSPISAAWTSTGPQGSRSCALSGLWALTVPH